jgi:hypothetical protein
MGKHNAEIIAAVIVPPFSDARRGKAHGQKERKRGGSGTVRRTNFKGDGERKSVPFAVVTVTMMMMCPGDSGTSIPREYLGNRRPIVAREARSDALLEGDIAYPHSAAEQRGPCAG